MFRNSAPKRSTATNLENSEIDNFLNVRCAFKARSRTICKLACCAEGNCATNMQECTIQKIGEAWQCNL